MQKIIVIAFVFCAVRGVGQVHTGDWGWAQVSGDSLLAGSGVTVLLSDFVFADSSAGYLRALSEEGPYSPSYSDRWYGTQDGGLTWKRIIADTFYFNSSGKVTAPSHKSVFIASSLYNYLFRSLDNGNIWDTIVEDWNKVSLGFFTMFSEKKGIGITKGNYPYLVRTTDGGKTFTGKYVDSLFTDCAKLAQENFYGMSFGDDAHGTYATFDNQTNHGKGLTTIVTTDGNSWKKYHRDFVAFPDDTIRGSIQYQKGTPNLWLLPNGYFYPNEANNDVYYYETHKNFNMSYAFSADYGANWNYDTSFAGRIRAFYAVSPGNVWLLLREEDFHKFPNGPFHSYTIAHTTDFGKTWDIDRSTLKNKYDNVFDAQAIYFTDANHGWIAAMAQGHPYIFRYIPEKNSVEHNTHPIGSPNTNWLAYPNPAANQVTINVPKYTQPLDAHLSDMVGRQYPASYTIANNNVVLDTHDLPAGIYLAVIKHTSGLNTSRFIIQK